MAYDTPSLFESLDADQTQQRVASRRALALADTRIANTMGQFLRGAQNVEEFAERLGLVQEDFDWLITSAAEEVGYDQPELLKETITASYREAVGPDFLDPNQGVPGAGPEQPSIAPAVTPSMGPGANPVPVNPAATVDPQAGAQGIPGMDPNNLEQQMGQPQQPIMASWKVSNEGLAFGTPSDDFHGYGDDPRQLAQEDQQASIPNADFLMQHGIDPAAFQRAMQEWDAQGNPAGHTLHDPQQSGDHFASGKVVSDGHWIEKAIKHPGALHKELGVPEGEKIPEDKLEEAEHSDNPKERERANLAETLKGMHHGSWQVVGGDGNTDLGGPEPKMDKAHKAPSPKDLADDDSGLWPTKHKDVTEVIERKNRSEEGHEPKEIGEKTTEQVDLPAAKGDDAGFATGGEDFGPHTKTFGDGKQVDPVTKETQD